MPKITPRILANRKKKDGKLEIMLALAHNGTTRYIKSGIFIDSADELAEGVVVGRKDARMLNLNLKRIVSDMHGRIADIEYAHALTCSELALKLRTHGIEDNPTLSVVFAEYMEVSSMKPASKELSMQLIKSATDFLGADFNLQRLSLRDIMRYDAYLRQRKNKPATIASKVSLVSKLFTYAHKLGYIQCDISPFSGYRPPEIMVRESWLSTDEIIRLRDLELPKGMASTIRDYIILSYYLGGINMVDLLKVDFATCRQTKMLKYRRTKTEGQRKVNKYVEFGIPDEAWPIIDRLVTSDGYFGTSYQRQNNMHYYFAQGIGALRKASGLPQLVYYSARKSFAQHAFQLGISTGIIDYILGHKLNRGGNTLYTYIIVTPDMATDAVRKVLDNLK